MGDETLNPKVEFMVGDVVTLKSGGLPMTIQELGDDGKVLCSYFEGYGIATVRLARASLCRTTTRFNPANGSLYEEPMG